MKLAPGTKAHQCSMTTLGPPWPPSPCRFSFLSSIGLSSFWASSALRFFPRRPAINTRGVSSQVPPLIQSFQTTVNGESRRRGQRIRHANRKSIHRNISGHAFLFLHIEEARKREGKHAHVTVLNIFLCSVYTQITRAFLCHSNNNLFLTTFL